MDRESKLIHDLYWENKFLTRMLASYKKKCKYLQRELKKRNKEMSRPRRVLSSDGSSRYFSKEELSLKSKVESPKEEVVAPKENKSEAPSEKDMLIKDAENLGIKVKRNWGVKKLLSAIAEELGETEEDL